MSTVCLFAVGVCVLVGFVPGLIAQLELAEPGQQIIPIDDPGLYNLAATLHGAAFGGAMPLAAIALSLALVAEERGLRVLRIVALLALIASPVAFGAVTVSALTAEWSVSEGIRELIPLAALVLLAANWTLVATVPSARAPAAVLGSLSLLALAGGTFIYMTLRNSGIDFALHDTHMMVAADHAFGVSILLGLLAAIVAWVILATRREQTVFGVIAGLVTIVTGFCFVSPSYGLGLMGMPRRYVDYPTPFADAHWAATIWALALSAGLVAAALWLLFSVARRKPLVDGGETGDF